MAGRSRSKKSLAKEITFSSAADDLSRPVAFTSGAETSNPSSDRSIVDDGSSKDLDFSTHPHFAKDYKRFKDIKLGQLKLFGFQSRNGPANDSGTGKIVRERIRRGGSAVLFADDPFMKELEEVEGERATISASSLPSKASEGRNSRVRNSFLSIPVTQKKKSRVSKRQKTGSVNDRLNVSSNASTPLANPMKQNSVNTSNSNLPTTDSAREKRAPFGSSSGRLPALGLFVPANPRKAASNLANSQSKPTIKVRALSFPPSTAAAPPSIAATVLTGGTRKKYFYQTPASIQSLLQSKFDVKESNFASYKSGGVKNEETGACEKDGTVDGGAGAESALNANVGLKSSSSFPNPNSAGSKGRKRPSDSSTKHEAASHPSLEPDRGDESSCQSRRGSSPLPSSSASSASSPKRFKQRTQARESMEKTLLRKTLNPNLIKGSKKELFFPKTSSITVDNQISIDPSSSVAVDTAATVSIDYTSNLADPSVSLTVEPGILTPEDPADPSLVSTASDPPCDTSLSFFSEPSSLLSTAPLSTSSVFPDTEFCDQDCATSATPFSAEQTESLDNLVEDIAKDSLVDKFVYDAKESNCPICYSEGVTSKLSICFIDFDDTVSVCPRDGCPYPVGLAVTTVKGIRSCISL